MTIPRGAMGLSAVYDCGISRSYSPTILETWPWGYKTFLCSTRLSTKIILLINVKMPTIVGILSFISMINTTSEILKAKTSLIVGILVFMIS